jgi:hypothetical protein
MDIQHIVQRVLFISTVILCLGLALLFAALQAGIF